MRWLLLTFLMCWAGLLMAGEGEQATVPKELQELIESGGYKAIDCEPLEGAITCHPLSIAYSLERYDRESGTSVLASAMNRFAVRQDDPVSRFEQIAPQLRNSPHTQAAAVSYFLAERLQEELEYNYSRLAQALERISEHGHHSIILTAVNTFRAIHQNAGVGELRLRINELINDVRRDLNQFGSFEIATLLSMVMRTPIVVLNGINDTEVDVMTIDYPEEQLSGEQLEMSVYRLDLTVGRHYQGLLFSMDSWPDSGQLNFVATPGHGLIPLQNLNRSPEEWPTLVESAIATTITRPVGSFSNECSAICHDAPTGGCRNRESGDKPVKSRFHPKLKKGFPKDIEAKWNRYYSQASQGRQQPVSRFGSSFYDKAWFVAFSALSSYMLLNGKIRNAIYQDVCGASDVRQCGKNYLYYAKESGEYILETGYGGVCGADDAWQCGSYYLKRSEEMVSYILTAGHEKVCGKMTWRECLKYYRGKDPAEVELKEAGYRY